MDNQWTYGPNPYDEEEEEMAKNIGCCNCGNEYSISNEDYHYLEDGGSITCKCCGKKISWSDIY